MIENLRFYQKAMGLYDLCWNDCATLLQDHRGKENAAQLIRSVGSISANIEEGTGRGFGKEYPQFLRISVVLPVNQKVGTYVQNSYCLPKLFHKGFKR